MRIRSFALQYSIFSCFLLAMIFMNIPTHVTCNARSYHTNSNETDMLSLLAIKAQITKGSSMEALTTWNTSFHFCQWKGVSCNKRHQRVTILKLPSQALKGYMSPAVGNLSFLRVLDLSNNSLQGEVPLEIGYLFRLEELHLHNNRLGGPIANNMSSWSKMRILQLQYNNFTGQVPFELGSLSSLVQFNLSSNRFSGPIPTSLGNLSLLEKLDVAGNMLTGPIPETIGRLKRLNVLSLSLNYLSGSIPSTIYNLTYLTYVSMGDNSLEGVFPGNMFLHLPEIRILNMFGNKISGAIPVSILNASKLEMLSLQGNKFSGMIPRTFRSPNLRWLSLSYNNFGTNDLSFITSLTNCSHLRILAVGDSNIEGVLPASIGNLSTKLELMLMATNKISGKIPSSISNLVSLSSIYLTNNQLTGNIPESIGSLQNLHELALGINKLSGNIPSSLGNLTSLNELWLRDNNLEGSIPASLGNCKGLLLLHLYGNALSGTIPVEIIDLSSLSISLDLSRNRLIGPLPSEVGRLTNLVELDVSRNGLSGEIPSTLGSCESLERLCLDDNSFHGTIPTTLRSLRGLIKINLSHNNLSGEILKDFENLRFLQDLNFSYNNFEGEVPIRGVFSNASQVSLFGNQGLCGGIPKLQLPKCSSKKHEKETLTMTLKIAISLISGLVGLSLVLFLLWTLLYKRVRSQSPLEPKFYDKLRINVSYQDLFRATNGFSSSNFLGMGGFGSVYKGILEPDMTTVAVKVLDLQKRGASKSFIRECEALRNIKHKNLVKVVTACSSLDHNGDEFKAIVYEFMPNGNLERWLHLDPEADANIQETKILSLSQKLSIAIDVATVLDYLHNECETPILHCDLKPSNILLDDQLSAHLGDFGLAKVIVPFNFQESSNQISTSADIKGTIGYAAPEYGMGSVATKQGDVYSFGIVLLEIFTGKRPVDNVFQDGLNLHALAKISLLEGVMEIIDHSILKEVEEQAINHKTRTSIFPIIQECLTSIIKVGVICSEESPRDRMDIHDALKELCTVKKLISK